MSEHCIRFVSVTHAASILGVVLATSAEAMTIAARPMNVANTVPRHVWIVVIQINNSNLMYSCTSSQSQAHANRHRRRVANLLVCLLHVHSTRGRLRRQLDNLPLRPHCSRDCRLCFPAPATVQAVVAELVLVV